MDNEGLSDAFHEVADLLEIRGANPFRVRAYRSAARTLENHPASIADVVRKEGAPALVEIRGIGKDLAAKIVELVETGRLEMLETLRAEIPESLVELTRIPGLGPKRVGQIWRELDVDSLDALEGALDEGALDALAGFGPALSKKIRSGLESVRAFAGRVRLDEAEEVVLPLLEELRGVDGVASVEFAGSLRRRKETVGDIDLLAVVAREKAAAAVMKRFAGLDGVSETLVRGPTKTSVRLGSGLQVDLRVVPPESAGAALHYFTGSKEHNVLLRGIAQKRGLKLNEYGVFRGDARQAGETEEDVYDALGLPWIPPELRHGADEVERARNGRLPRLVTLDAIRGDLQMHTTASDGRESLEAMVEACRQRGYEYMAVTDHSQSMRVANGLTPERFRAQYREIEALQPRFDDIRILRSAEVDILLDGSLDLPDDVLEEMDVVLVSVHSRMNLPRSEMTRRITRALRHPRVAILAHPTGRLLNQREPYPLDVDEVLRVAAGEGVLVECNASPARLDLKDVHLAAARDAGVPVVISTDAHRTGQLDDMRYGVDQARRAGLEPEHVANARPLAEFLALLGIE